MSKKIRIGINGFGRIGRTATRIILSRPELEIAAINSRAASSSHAYLLKYDSTYGVLPLNVTYTPDQILVGKNKISVFNYDDPAQIPWDKAKVDVVIDSTGKFRTTDELKKHLKKGVKAAILSAPAKDDTKAVIMGINHKTITNNDVVISNSSCTTNCLATTLKVLMDNFGINRAFMTTVHAVTDSQNLLDNSHKKEVRLRRAAFASMIPASTGSARDIVKFYPELKGEIVCQSLRVPLLTVSMINLVCEIGKNANREEINETYTKASNTYLKGILDVSHDELVSVDYVGNSHSSIVDTYLTQVLSDNLVNIQAWYDNEWGYTNRLVDLVTYVVKRRMK